MKNSIGTNKWVKKNVLFSIFKLIRSNHYLKFAVAVFLFFGHTILWEVSFGFASSMKNVLNKGQTNYDLFSVSFPTEKEGWVCGRWGTVLHTKNGGESWNLQPSNTDYTLSSIFFLDTMHGWVVGDGGTILYTPDGGKTWIKQLSPTDLFLMGVHFISDQKGWIVGERTHILYTEDGGKHWQIQFKDEDFILKSVSFCDPLTGWAVGEYGFTYHTTNGGQTWEKQAGFYSISEETYDILGGNYLFDVFAVDPENAWVVGIDGYAAQTNDGGTTWQTVTNGIPKVHLFSVYVSNKSTVIIGGKGILLNSTDAGKGFQLSNVKPEITYEWIYGVNPKGTNGFAAVGKEGSIYISDHKGITWNLSN